MKQITNWQKATVADIEADDLLKGATLMHVLSFQLDGGPVKSIGKKNQAERLRKFFQYHIDKKIPIVMHNGISYDVALAEKLLEMDLSELMLIDSLALSWYLNTDRKIHGLGSFHEDYGIEKPPVDDWKNLTYEEYRHRCIEDVKLNKALWEDLKARLIDMYTHAKEHIDTGDVGGTRISPDEEIYLDQFVGQEVEQHIDRLLTFLMFKMDCARLQEKTRWAVDVAYYKATHDQLEAHIEGAKAELASVMPQVPKYAPRQKPAKPFLMKGGLSKSGEAWEEIRELIRTDAKDEDGNPKVKLVDDTQVKLLVGYEEPNVNSPEQIKKFLFSKGWKPITFNYVRDKEAFSAWIDSKPTKGSPRGAWSRWKDAKPEDREVPQVSVKGDDGKELCPSVVELAEEVPEINAYSKYTTIKHRLDTIKGFLNNLEDGKYLTATIGGFTNTLRVKHRGIVNLPGVDKPYGEEIRGGLIAGEGCTSMGADLSSLEDRVKICFMLAHDPEYVETISQEGYDPHLETAMTAGLMTEQEYEDFKNGIKSDNAKAARRLGKTTNYCSVYNGSPPTIARSAGVSLKEGETLHTGYWKLNWSVKAIAEEQCVFEDKSGKKWLINPINGFCYALRKESDRFSTLCQGTGSWIFDMWVDKIQTKLMEKYKRKRLTASFHDECVITIKDRPKAREAIKEIVEGSIEEVNTEYKLRRAMGCDVQFGYRYSQIH